MGDADDVRAIQAMLAPMLGQLGAAVEACKTKLDAGALATWDVLAKRLLAFASEPVSVVFNAAQLARARHLRTDVNVFLVRLKALGCGDIAQAIHDAPAPTPAPAHLPGDKPNPLASLFDGPQAWVTLALVVYFATRKG